MALVPRRARPAGRRRHPGQMAAIVVAVAAAAAAVAVGATSPGGFLNLLATGLCRYYA